MTEFRNANIIISASQYNYPHHFREIKTSIDPYDKRSFSSHQDGKNDIFRLESQSKGLYQTMHKLHKINHLTDSDKKRVISQYAAKYVALLSSSGIWEPSICALSSSPFPIKDPIRRPELSAGLDGFRAVKNEGVLIQGINVQGVVDPALETDRVVFFDVLVSEIKDIGDGERACSIRLEDEYNSFHFQSAGRIALWRNRCRCFPSADQQKLGILLLTGTNKQAGREVKQ